MFTYVTRKVLVPSADATISDRLTNPNRSKEGDCSSGRPVIVL